MDAAYTTTTAQDSTDLELSALLKAISSLPESPRQETEKPKPPLVPADSIVNVASDIPKLLNDTWNDDKVKSPPPELVRKMFTMLVEENTELRKELGRRAPSQQHQAMPHSQAMVPSPQQQPSMLGMDCRVADSMVHPPSTEPHHHPNMLNATAPSFIPTSSMQIPATYAVITSQPIPATPQNQIPKPPTGSHNNICRHWVVNRCTYGSECRFVHPPHDSYVMQQHKAQKATSDSYQSPPHDGMMPPRSWAMVPNGTRVLVPGDMIVSGPIVSGMADEAQAFRIAPANSSMLFPAPTTA